MKYIASAFHLPVPITSAVSLVRDAQTDHVSASLNQHLWK